MQELGTVDIADDQVEDQLGWLQLLTDVDNFTTTQEGNLEEYHHEVVEGRHFLVNSVDRLEVLTGSVAMKQLCRICKVPAKFIEKCSDDLVGHIFSEFYPGGDKPMVNMVLQDKNILRAVLPEKTEYVSNLEIYRAWESATSEHNVSDVVMSGGHFHSPETELVWTFHTYDTVEFGNRQYDLGLAAQLRFSEINPKVVVLNALCKVDGVYLPIFSRSGNWAAFKYKAYSPEILKAFIQEMYEDLDRDQWLERLVNKADFSMNVVPWLDDLERHKGVPTSALKEARMMYTEGEKSSALGLVVDLLKPYQYHPLGNLALEKAISYKLSFFR